jgi:hypothetical protein
MPIWKIPVVWSNTGFNYIEADTVEEAAEKAQDAPLPDDSYYLEGSFGVCTEDLPEEPEYDPTDDEDYDEERT